ncbi:MAG: tetratricopeptide repeat protein [Acidobacteriaceae bacterium]|nr:tetratricopeptide repeat protein [Acidobacteriaceae bacterium]
MSRYLRPWALRLALLLCAAAAIAMAFGVAVADLRKARDRQDLPALDGLIAQLKGSADAAPRSAEAQYRLALAYSYAAEVAMELHDKKKSEGYAEAGMAPARKAADENSGNAEYHRLLGEICGQVIPASPLMGTLKYGPCAKDEIDKAIQLDGNLALAYVSRGVGNYYLPSSMGGGVDLALKDFDKAIQLDPNLADAYIWKAVALRKANRDPEARQDLQKALQLDPDRVWAKDQLGKTPVH